jgi:hypothetical protein
LITAAPALVDKFNSTLGLPFFIAFYAYFAPSTAPFCRGRISSFPSAQANKWAVPKDKRNDQPLWKLETIMKNYHLNAIAGLLSLFVAGHALAEDASTNGIPTALLQLYTGPTAVVADSSTNGIPTAILEQYSGFGCPAQTDIANKDMSDSPDLTTGSVTAVNDGAATPSCK